MGTREFPEFLKPENIKPLTEEQKKFRELRKKYEERFGESICIAEYGYSTAVWIKMIEKCLEKNIRIQKVIREKRQKEYMLYVQGKKR